MGAGWGLEILPVSSCYRNQYGVQPDGPLGLSAHLTFSSYLQILLAELHSTNFILCFASQISETKQTEYCLQWLARNAG